MNIIEIFKQICTIPRCSYNTEHIAQFIIDEATASGYAYETDKAGNILVFSDTSKITLQAHMDMVCIGEFKNMKLIIKDEMMSAENSTLGADNAMAIAMMIALMREGAAVDFLFTNDEEVGLVGARALRLKIRTAYLLNLDSEDEGVLTLGCAGGVDIVARKKLKFESFEGHFYTLEASGYEGGHSGVDIHLDIKNAIKELANHLSNENFKISHIEGGERRNSIAKKATAIVASVKELDLECVEKQEVIQNSDEILEMIAGFKHGVRAYNSELDIVQSSINLAKISTDNEDLKIEMTARSMNRESLDGLIQETKAYFRAYDMELETSDYYEPWEIEHSTFSALVLESAKGIYENVEVSAIHAGLECGILKTDNPDVLFCSIGPSIYYPHSTRESVDLASVARTFSWLKNIITGIR